MKPKAVLEAWIKAFQAHDVDTLCSLYAEDAVNYQVAEDPLQGIPAIRESFNKTFAAFPDMGCEVVNLYEDGDWAMWEWIGSSTFLGELDGRPPTGKRLEGLRGCGFFQVKDGKIVMQRGYWDRLTFLHGHDIPLEQGISK